MLYILGQNVDKTLKNSSITCCLVSALYFKERIKSVIFADGMEYDRRDIALKCELNKINE